MPQLRTTPARPRRSDRDALPPDVGRARWALVGLFAVNGLTLSAWLARLPAIRDALDLAPSQLGSVLLAAALGGLATMTVAPRIVGRLGQAGAIRVFGSLFGAAYLLMGLAAATASLPLLAAGLFLNGIAFATTNLAINIGSADVERRVGRPILSQFHAAFSIGTVVGSLGGAAAAGLAVPLLAQFVVMAVVAVAWRWAAAARLLPHRAAASTSVRGLSRHRPARPADASSSGTRAGHPATRAGLLATWREPRALLIGAIVLMAVISEFAANDWLALAMVDGRGARESLAALVFALFVGAMTMVRLVGSALLARFGRVAVLRGGALVSIAGVLLFVLAPTVPLAALGAVAWGAGAALNFPIAVSASSDDPERAAHRISVMSMFAAVAPLIEPLGIGLLAEQVGVRYALLAVVGVLLFVALAARQVRPERPAAPTPAAGAAALEETPALVAA
jgi:fucose permease